MTRGYMKRFVSIIMITVFAALLSVCGRADFRASFSLTGASSARAGENITVAFKADGNGICGILAEISYDTSLLTYRSSSGALSDWKVEVTEKDGRLQIWAEENNSFRSPIKSQQTVINLSFRVSSNAKTGDKFTVNADIQQVSDTENELSGLTASYSGTVARPLSTDSKLRSLSVDGYTLTPEFSANKTEYEINGEVEYTLSALKITAAANDGEAKVDISGSRLSVGSNTIRIKVTAESGDTTTYTIKAKMKQDPDYVKSSDSSLSSISVSEGRLSPAFSQTTYSYVVYVPFEVETVKVSGTPADKKASCETSGENALAVGENVITVICTAEDGAKTEYYVNVIRMEQYITETDTDTGTETVTDTDTETDTDTGPETEPDIQTDTETEPLPVTGSVTDDTTAEEETETLPLDTTETEEPVNTKVPVWVVVAAAVGGIIIGAFSCVLVQNSIKERR